jgi:hypothetical protein
VQPETRYARLDGDRIAYQVLGSGPPDLVLVRRSYGHIDIAWEDPGTTLFLRAMAEVDVRPILPLVQTPTLILHRRGSSWCLSNMAATWPSTSPGPG